MIDILIAVGISLTVSILLTPMLIRLFTRQGFGHEIREDGPPSHKTKRGTPSMGGVAILAGIWAGYLGTHLAGLAFNGAGPVGLWSAGAVFGHHAGRGRIRRRPDQDSALTQPGTEQDGQDRRPDHRRRAGRSAGLAIPQRRRPDTGHLRPVVCTRNRHRHTGSRAFRVVLRGRRQRLVQRGQLHRRPGRAGSRRDGHGYRRLRADHVLAVPQRLCDHAGAGLLQRARSAGPGDHRGCDGGRVHRVSVVERRAGQDLHGRHRIAGARAASSPGYR